jgi:hypothetical protein
MKMHNYTEKAVACHPTEESAIPPANGESNTKQSHKQEEQNLVRFVEKGDKRYMLYI